MKGQGKVKGILVQGNDDTSTCSGSGRTTPRSSAVAKLTARLSRWRMYGERPN